MIDTLRTIQGTSSRRPGGHLEVRGTRSSFAEATDLLHRLGACENLALPRNLMALGLAAADEGLATTPYLTTLVADDAKSLRQLRSVVGQSFSGSTPEEAAEADVEADFFYALRG